MNYTWMLTYDFGDYGLFESDLIEALSDIAKEKYDITNLHKLLEDADNDNVLNILFADWILDVNDYFEEAANSYNGVSNTDNPMKDGMYLDKLQKEK